LKPASPLLELTCIWDHAMLPVSRQRWHSRSSTGFTTCSPQWI